MTLQTPSDSAVCAVLNDLGSDPYRPESNGEKEWLLLVPRNFSRAER
jgi:hypothetical protein